MTRTFLIIAVSVLLISISTTQSAEEWGDIKFKRESPGAKDFPPAVYPHWIHRMQFKCYVCHEEIFKMKAGANPITMQAISEGKFCGVCHNNKIAFAPNFEYCWRCHKV